MKRCIQSIQDMNPTRIARAASLAGALAVSTCALAAPNEADGALEFSEVFVIIEINDTDGDAGLQIFLDADAWSEVAVHAPDGRKLLSASGLSGKDDLGRTELFSESEEPPLKELPLEDFLKMFPEGEYMFTGTTVEGDDLLSFATLTHDLPDGPVLISPKRGELVDPTDAAIAWEPVPAPDPGESEIILYQVIVALDKPTRSLVIDLPPTETSLTIPREFLEGDTEYKFEVIARETSGNQTITETTFTTAAKGSPPCDSDLDDDDEVTFADLLILLNSWGECDR